MGLLDVETDLKESKTTSQVIASINKNIPLINNTYENLKGYEIHMGESLTDNPIFSIKRTAENKTIMDGSAKGSVWGTYIHGIFDNDRLRRDIVNSLRERKGLPPVESLICYESIKEQEIDRWASILKEHVDIDFILNLIEN
jgi:adenosylcobyric acid synthase